MAVIGLPAGTGLPSSNCTRVQVFPSRASMVVIPSPAFPGVWPVAGPVAGNGAAQPGNAVRARTVASWKNSLGLISHLLGPARAASPEEIVAQQTRQRVF